MIPPVRAYWSPTTNPDDTPVPVELTKYLLWYKIERGRAGGPVAEVQNIPPGKATVRLYNGAIGSDAGRRFDPWFTTGPWYGYLEPGKLFWIELGENLIANPSFETNLTGWSDAGSVSRLTDSSSAWDGKKSMEVDTNTPGTADSGTSYSVSGLTVGQQYTISCRTKCYSGGVGKTFKLSVNATGTPQATRVYTASATWYKVVLTFTASATTHIFSFVAVTGFDFNIDAAQLVVGAEQPFVPAPKRRFTGEIEGWPQDWQGRMNQVTITVLDGLDTTADAEVTTGLVVPTGLTGAHINAVLDDIGIPAGRRDIDTGTDTIQAHTFEVAEKAIDYAQKVALTEQGYFFADVYNKFVFYERHAQIAAPLNVVATIFSNNPAAGEFAMEDVNNPDYSAKLIRNSITVQPEGLEEQRYESIASPAHRRRSASFSTLHANVNEAFDAAAFLVFKYRLPQIFVSGLEVAPQENDDMWNQVLSHDLASRIRTKIQPPGPTGVIDVQSNIQHITEEYSIDSGYKIEYDTIPPYPVWPMWYLGVAGKSELGTTTYVGY